MYIAIFFKLLLLKLSVTQVLSVQYQILIRLRDISKGWTDRNCSLFAYNLFHLPNLCDYKLLHVCIKHALLGKVHLEDK